MKAEPRVCELDLARPRIAFALRYSCRDAFVEMALFMDGY